MTCLKSFGIDMSINYLSAKLSWTALKFIYNINLTASCAHKASKLVISRRCFTEDHKESYQKLKTHLRKVQYLWLIGKRISRRS